MEKQCCAINVTEIEDGYRVEIKGEGVKEHCKSAMSNCCSGEGMKRFFQNFCCSGKGNTTGC